MGDGGESDRKSHHTGSDERYWRPVEQEKNSKKKDCFVASVVYGDANAREVNILRGYRDNVLMKSYWGRQVVGAYYGIGSKRIANFVEKRARFLIPIIRKGLDFVVEDYLENNKE